MSKPPGWKSLELIFTRTANPGLTRARIRRTISSRNRDRFSRLPPHWSVRRLVVGDRNCPIR